MKIQSDLDLTIFSWRYPLYRLLYKLSRISNNLDKTILSREIVKSRSNSSSISIGCWKRSSLFLPEWTRVCWRRPDPRPCEWYGWAARKRAPRVCARYLPGDRCVSACNPHWPFRSSLLTSPHWYNVPEQR